MSAVTTLSNNPDTLWKILSRSATQLERDLLKTTSSDEFRRAFSLIPTVKRELEPTDWIPFLLIEYGAAEAAKLFKDWPILLDYIKRIRGKQGTPMAVEEMAKLMRYAQNEIWEEKEATLHFPEFQLDLGQYEGSLARLCTLRKLVNTVKPERCRFRRVFHGWDERQMVWDDDDYGSFWDSDSGVDILPLGLYGDYRADDQFLVSLGQSFTGQVTLPVISLIDNSDPQRGFPLVLVERHFMSGTNEEFFPRFDTEAWDGDIIEDPGFRNASSNAGVPLVESSLLTVWEQSYASPVAADVSPILMDYDGFDGEIDRAPTSINNQVTDMPAMDVDSTQVDEVAHTSESGGVPSVVTDEEAWDGEASAESSFALE